VVDGSGELLLKDQQVGFQIFFEPLYELVCYLIGQQGIDAPNGSGKMVLPMSSRPGR